ncbi:MAG: LysM peptidoglycan-binding domain-containing protein [Proteobacteria bacterium]|nr:LysM peptidoglycan-binding domain-containing protein [Pseudomonadota bacterium]
MYKWVPSILWAALSAPFGNWCAFAQGDESASQQRRKSENIQDGTSLERSTPSDNFNDVNANGALDGPASSSNSGNESPAIDDPGQFDVSPPKNANVSIDPFNNVPASNSKSPTETAIKPVPVQQDSPPAASPPAKTATAPNPTPLPVSKPETAASNPPLPPVVPPVAAGTTLPPSEVATGQEELQPKAAALTIDAPPLPPPNEFAGAPPIPGTMRAMAEGEAPEEYQVEPGDNLYDICDQLLDEAGYWPKLWALNPDIKNPHFIFPNMRLRFYAGDDETPPYLQVVSEDDVIPIDKGTLDESQLVAEKVYFPQRSAVTDYVVEVIGPSQVDMLQDEILTGGRIANLSEKPVHVPAFIYAKERDALAVITGGRDGEANVAAGNQVFMEPASSVSVGTIYTVIRPAGEVEDPDSGDFVGYRYYYIANVRVAHATTEKNFVGEIQDSQLGVSPGDMVVAYISSKRTVPIDDSVAAASGVPARIVAWENIDQEVGGRGDIALIDRGSNGGVTVGSYLPIYGTPGFFSLSSGDKGLPTDYSMVGSMRIIDVTDVGACGYIVRSSEAIRIGDRTNKG